MSIYFLSGNGTEAIVRKYPHPSRQFFFSLHLYDKEGGEEEETVSEMEIKKEIELKEGMEGLDSPLVAVIKTEVSTETNSFPANDNAGAYNPYILVRCYLLLLELIGAIG